jgi:anti-sigma B factor antagonist
MIVDLTRVTFMDSSALGVLIGAARQSAGEVTGLRLVYRPGRISRVISITGLNRQPVARKSSDGVHREQ